MILVYLYFFIIALALGASGGVIATWTSRYLLARIVWAIIFTSSLAILAFLLTHQA